MIPQEDLRTGLYQVTGGRFQPGQSGNAGGRPKVLESIRELARAHTDEAINVAVAIMRDPTSPEATRLKAVELVLDRGWGKPETSANVQLSDNRDVAALSFEDLAALVAREHADDPEFFSLVERWLQG